MRFKLRVKHLGDPDDKAWEEEYEKPVDDPGRWARETIARFNSALRPGERFRVLLSVERLEGEAREHTWSKTNLVTIIGPVGMYDAMKCEHCGITGKRYGLGRVTIDSRFRAKVYQRCDTTLKHLAKTQEKVGR